MSYRVKLIFSSQPAIDDSIQINSQFIETFKTSRSLQGETAIGSDLNETILNLQNAFIADYQNLFPFTSNIENNTLILNFNGYNEGFIDIHINSSVITFELIEGYFPYFVSVYNNRVDNFELIIEGKDINFESENINAVATLSYKDVDNTLEPIRGAQCDIEVDANIEKPFDLFLDFRETDFRVKLYRNGDLIFLGFLNPEGVSQSYTSINWRAKLTAFDNLGGLKNKEFKYNNELPSEFVFLDKCLKRTGLDLPIAFFDDINQVIRNENQTQISDYNADLKNGLTERIINPNSFLNENNTYQDCETILKDILQKYNAFIVQQNIQYVEPLSVGQSSGEKKNILCWLFARVPLTQTPFSINSLPKYFIQKITGYVDDGQFNDVFEMNILTPEIETLGQFINPRKTLGTDGQSGLDAIHKNKNQLIRQTRALQNFRFEHKYIERLKAIVNPDFIPFSQFTYIGQAADNILFQQDGDFAEFVGGEPISLGTTISEPFDFPSTNSKPYFVKHKSIQVPEEANQIKVNGKGLIQFVPNGNDLVTFTALHFAVVHTDLSGNKRVLQQPPSNDQNTYIRNQFYIPQKFNFSNSFWSDNDELITDENGNYELAMITHTLFSYKREQSGSFFATSNFEFDFPATPVQGGTYDIYFTHLATKTSILNDVQQSIGEKMTFRLEDFKIRIIPPDYIGKGLYYDAENTQDISSKSGNKIKIINADEKTNIFANYLKRIKNGQLENYDNWTSVYNIDMNKTDILELTSIERVRLYAKSQNIFSGDIHGYLPYFCTLTNTAYNSIAMVFTKWVYNTANNTIEAEAMENKLKSPNVNFEKTIIFEDEDKKLID